MLGRWSLGVLKFYAETEPETFAEFHEKMAEWAKRVYNNPSAVSALNIRFPMLFITYKLPCFEEAEKELRLFCVCYFLFTF